MAEYGTSNISNQEGTTNNQQLEGSNQTFPIQLKKKLYSTKAVNDLIDRSFSDFDQKNVERDVKRLFQLYNEVFFDINKEGEESHTTLFIKSRDYLRDFVDPKDAEIFGLTEEIADLNEEILMLQTQLISGSNSVLPSAQELEELEEGVDIPMLDENNDGVDDLTQNFSNFGTPRRLILEPPNEKLKNILRNPSCQYYKDKFYGQQIYKFKKKVEKKSDRLVVYEGSKGKTGKRFIFDIKDGKSYKIAKRKWKSKHRDKIFKP